MLAEPWQDCLVVDAAWQRAVELPCCEDQVRADLSTQRTTGRTLQVFMWVMASSRSAFFFAVADNTPFMHPGGIVFVSFLRVFLVGPHVQPLADHRKMRRSSPGHFAPDFASVRFLTILREGKLDGGVQS